jgi:rhomboid protease GluP
MNGAGHPADFTPWLTRGLVAANVLVFAAMAFAGAGITQPQPLAHIAWGSNFAALTTSGEWWRLATATFLHFGALHLLFNMWALWGTGGLVERLFGHGRFAAIYAASGLAGSLASIGWNPLVNSAGASGAIFGVIGAQLAFFLRGGHRIPAEVIRAQRNSTLGFIGYSVVFGLTVPGIDNAAHLGGLACGFVMGWLLASPIGVVDDAARARLGAALAAGFAVTVVATGGWAATTAAAAHASEQAYMRTWYWYATTEPAILAKSREVTAAASARKLADRAAADRLEREVVPFYREAAGRLATATLPAGSPLADDRRRLLDFTQGRVAGFELMIAGIRENDRTRLEQAVRLLERNPGAQPGR